MDTTGVVERLRKLKEYIEELQPYVSLTLEEYLGDKERQRAIERTLQLAAQVCIDIGNYLVAYYGLQTPDKPENIFSILGRENLISEPLAQRLVGLVRFRNILVHGYLVIDPLKVQAALANDSDLFFSFATAIEELIERDQRENGGDAQ